MLLQDLMIIEVKMTEIHVNSFNRLSDITQDFQRMDEP